MGVHIIVRDKDYNRHPEWDTIRYHNDREVVSLLVRQEPVWGDVNEFGDSPGFHPKDMDAFRELIRQRGFANESRYMQLCDIMEDGWLVYLSY